MGFFDKFKKNLPPPSPPSQEKTSEKSLLEERLSPLYPKLVRQAVSMTPVEWDMLYYLGEVEPGKASYSSVFYIRESKTGNIVQSNEFPKIYGVSNADYMTQWIKLNDILLEIYQCFVDGGHKPWEQLSLTLEKTGKFNIHFNYDSVHANSDGQPSREVLWAYQTFGYMPEEGSWMRKLLDKQL